MNWTMMTNAVKTNHSKMLIVSIWSLIVTRFRSVHQIRFEKRLLLLLSKSTIDIHSVRNGSREKKGHFSELILGRLHCKRNQGKFERIIKINKLLRQQSINVMDCTWCWVFCEQIEWDDSTVFAVGLCRRFVITVILHPRNE